MYEVRCLASRPCGWHLGSRARGTETTSCGFRGSGAEAGSHEGRMIRRRIGGSARVRYA